MIEKLRIKSIASYLISKKRLVRTHHDDALQKVVLDEIVMGGAKIAPNPFFPLKKQGFSLFWPDGDDHCAIGSTHKNRDCFIGIQGFHYGLKLLNSSDVSIANAHNHITGPHPCAR